MSNLKDRLDAPAAVAPLVLPPSMMLPDKLWQLIDLALADLRKVEKDPRYHVDMAHWHKPIVKSQWRQSSQQPACYVCLAGAVMAKSLGMKPIEYGKPDMFPKEIAFKLLALDLVRRWEVARAVEIFYVGIGKELSYGQYNGVFRYAWPSYTSYGGHYGVGRFHDDMALVRNRLQAFGV